MFLASLNTPKFGPVLIHLVPRLGRRGALLMSQDDPLNELIGRLDLDVVGHNLTSNDEFGLDPSKLDLSPTLLASGRFEPTGRTVATEDAQRVEIWRLRCS